MLAYLFWHRPLQGVDAAEYEAAQVVFHGSLAIESACFRVEALPFGAVESKGPPGYEDWYLVEDWEALDRLNETAVDDRHRPSHDLAASQAATGWGGVYKLIRGEPAIPLGVEWRDKPRGVPTDEFVDSLDGGPVWRRQLVLGPAPEFCIGAPLQQHRWHLASA